MMNLTLNNSVLRFLEFSWLMGPIFGKELRVSSRRRRNYMMRFTYVAFLTVFLIANWVDVVKVGGSSTFTASRLARAGKQIIVALMWFQFYATQFVAVVMLSTAISDEIYHRTLGVLMTTPITSFQIVLGKLSSKLLQIILLLFVSLPVLAIVRIFGGVPWDYIISSFCMTLTTLLFVSTLSLFFSIFYRRAYVVIILTIVTLGFLFGFPLLLKIIPTIVLCHVNPYVTLDVNTSLMLNPSRMGRVHFSWAVHCGIMLAASTSILIYCIRTVRKIALARTSGRIDLFERLRRFWILKFSGEKVAARIQTQIRPVKGPPVVWKELKLRISSREKLIVWIIIGLEAAMVVALYLFPVVENAFGHEDTHMYYIWVFMGLGMLSVTIFPSSSITSEKERRSWPLLLTTTLNDWQIIFDKFVGVLRRSLFFWLLLFVYVGLFWFYQCVGPYALIHVIFIITGTIVFLCGTGFYFSSRLISTSGAVITNIALAASLWGLVPLFLVLIEDTFRSLSDLVECYLSLVPFVQARVVLISAFKGWSSYRWPGHYHGSLESTFLIFSIMLGYMLVGVLFAWRATRCFRRNIF